MENELTHPDWDEEFLPLPYYPYETRPHATPLHPDEIATAIHLANGSLPRAATLLRTPLIRLARHIRHSPRLQRVLDEHIHLAALQAAAEPLHALFDPASDDRRREWASTKILASRAATVPNEFQPAPNALTPAPPAPSSSAASLTLTPAGQLTFRWRTDADDAKTIDHDGPPGSPTPGPNE